jgi:uncharacterized protein (DUF488 family)
MTLSGVTIYSVGHGDRPLARFVALLQSAAIVTLVDVRAQPGSRRHPQYDMEPLREALARANIVYHWAGRALGGHREARADSAHTALTGAMRGYADHMETEAFARGIAQLVHLAAKSPTAMMCAERQPEHCHRSLIADYLVLKGIAVEHLIDPGETREHLLDPRARRESVQLVYDRGVAP